MNWHKHSSLCTTDRPVKRLIRKHGATGYGVYIYVRELVARGMTSQSPDPSIEEDVEDIAADLNTDVTIVKAVVEMMAAEKLIEYVDGIISCPNIYEWIDPSQSRSPEIIKMVKLYRTAQPQSETAPDITPRVPDSPGQSETIPDNAVDVGDCLVQGREREGKGREEEFSSYATHPDNTPAATAAQGDTAEYSEVPPSPTELPATGSSNPGQSRASPAPASPQKRPKSKKNRGKKPRDELAVLWQEALTAETPMETWSDPAKQYSNLVVLAGLTRQILPKSPFSEPSALIAAVKVEYQRRKDHAKTDYWRGATYEPSALITRWSQVWDRLLSETRKHDTGSKRAAPPKRCDKCGGVVWHSDDRAQCRTKTCRREWDYHAEYDQWAPVSATSDHAATETLDGGFEDWEPTENHAHAGAS